MAVLLEKKCLMEAQQMGLDPSRYQTCTGQPSPWLLEAPPSLLHAPDPRTCGELPLGACRPEMCNPLLNAPPREELAREEAAADVSPVRSGVVMPISKFVAALNRSRSLCMWRC